MLAVLARSLLAMLVVPENLNARRRSRGEEGKNSLLVLPNPLYIVFYSLICTFRIFSPLETTQQIMRVFSSLCQRPGLRQKVPVITLLLKTD